MSYAKNPIGVTKPQKQLLRQILSLEYEAKLNDSPQRGMPIKESQNENKKQKKEGRAISETKIPSQPKIKSKQEIAKMQTIGKTEQDAEVEKIDLSEKNIDPSHYLIAYQNQMKNQAHQNPPDFLNSPTYTNSPRNLAKRLKEKEDEFAFLKEKNEWVAINKFQLYKDAQEKQIKKENYFKEMEKLTKFIDVQLHQKKERMKMKTQEDHQYLNFLKEKYRKETEKEQEMREIKKQRKKIEKVLRDTEIKQKIHKKRELKQKQRELEEKVVVMNPKTMEQEVEKKNQTKLKETEISEQYFIESQLKKNEKLEARKQEKVENLQYQRNYGEELDQKEAIRQAFIKEKENNVLQNLESALSYDKNTLEPKKYQKIVEGFAKSVERQNKIVNEEKENEKLKKTEKFLDLKMTLEEQIRIKREKDERSKKRYDNQMEIWKQQNDIYNEIEAQKKREKQLLREQWAKELQKQIEEREERKNKYKNKMSEEESLMNKPLLDELQNFKSVTLGRYY